MKLAGDYGRAISRSEHAEFLRAVLNEESDVRRKKRSASVLFARLQSLQETGIAL